MSELAARIDAELPQTQCTRCAYPSCRDYAEAIAAGAAPINRCPPGGAPTIAALAALLDTAELALDPAHGVEVAWPLARIDEARCIGCTKCIQACPVDAISGAARLMHVILPELCTGCGLCLPPCPVDCIELLPAPAEAVPSPLPARLRPESAQARARYEARFGRAERKRALREQRMEAKRDEWSREHAQELLAAALARARSKRPPAP